MSETKDTRNIHQRILDVMRSVEYVQKEEKAAGMPYRAISHDKVTHLTRRHFVDNGINCYSSIESSVQSGNRTESVVRTFFVNVDNPEDRFHVDTVGYGIDSQDKGPGKAFSYGVKGAIVKALNIESGTEDEIDFQNVEYQANPTDSDPPELDEITRQIDNGRAAMRETVVDWLEIPEAKITEHTAKDLAKAISKVVSVYYGHTEKWFTEHIREAHPEQYGDGKPDTVMKNVTKPQVINTFKKVRKRALALAEIEDDGNTVTRVQGALSKIEDPDIGLYDLDDPEFTEMIQKIINHLKGGTNG